MASILIIIILITNKEDTDKYCSKRLAAKPARKFGPLRSVPFTRYHYYGTGFCKARGHTVTDECPKGTSHVTE